MKDSTRKKLALRRKQQQSSKLVTRHLVDPQPDLFVEAEATTQVAKPANEEIRGPDSEE